jgi:hypothetical protein
MAGCAAPAVYAFGHDHIMLPARLLTPDVDERHLVGRPTCKERRTG